MSFVPAIPMGGLAGWRFLERTAESQRAAFEKGPMLQREIQYFKENIAKVKSPEDLVRDRRLLTVALGAFGLEAELDKKFFLKKILEGGTDDPASLANRVSERGFRKMAEAFGFGNEAGAQTAKEGFAEKIVEAFKTRQFDAAVGNVDESMRLAMAFRRDIDDVAATAKEGQGWFTILGSRGLRSVIETALGLPKEFGRIDVDRQRDMVRARMQSVFGDGSIEFFRDPANVEKVVNRYLARAQIEAGMNGAAANPILQLFQGDGQSQAEGLFAILAQRR
jgi:hypothetical protein